MRMGPGVHQSPGNCIFRDTVWCVLGPSHLSGESMGLANETTSQVLHGLSQVTIGQQSMLNQ